MWFDTLTAKSGRGPSVFCFGLQTCFVQLFHIWTSNSGPEMVCFAHVDLKTRFAPQRRAIFPHLHFQKWPGNGVFCTTWLENVLRATAPCNFSFLLWRHGSAPAALASLLFDPTEPQINGKTQHFATFLTFRTHVSSFFWLYFFFLLFIFWLYFSALLAVSPHCRKFDF